MRAPSQMTMSQCPQYVGVYERSGQYEATLVVLGQPLRIGTYTSASMARDVRCRPILLIYTRTMLLTKAGLAVALLVIPPTIASAAEEDRQAVGLFWRAVRCRVPQCRFKSR